MDANFVVSTLLVSQALARTFHNPELEQDCAKAIETVRELASVANGWASKYPRKVEDAPHSLDDSRPAAT